jgi:hypothetical protein
VYAVDAAAWWYLPQAHYRFDGAWLYAMWDSAPVVDWTTAGYRDTGSWLGVVFATGGDWIYAFGPQAWIAVPAAGRDSVGAWVYAPNF